MYTKIIDDLNEIEHIDLMKTDDETLEDFLVQLDEVMSIVTVMHDEDESGLYDGISTDVMEQIETLQFSIDQELETRYADAYEEDY